MLKTRFIRTYKAHRLVFFGSPYAIGPLSCLSVCDVGVLWPNGWTDQDETWHVCRPRPWPHCVTWGPSAPSPKGAKASIGYRCNSAVGWDE